MIFMLECQEIYFTSECGVFDDFSKITEDSAELVRRSHERRQKCFGNFRRLPKTFEFEEDSKMLPLYTNEFKWEKNLISVKWAISSLVIRIWKIRHQSPGCGSLWFLPVVYFSKTLVSVIPVFLFPHLMYSLFPYFCKDSLCGSWVQIIGKMFPQNCRRTSWCNN